MLCINSRSIHTRKQHWYSVNQEFRNTMVHRTLLKPSEKMSNSLRSDNPFSLITQKPIHQVLLQIPSSTLYQCCFLHFAADLQELAAYIPSPYFFSAFRQGCRTETAGRRPAGNPPHERRWDEKGKNNNGVVFI